ncbi:MAG: glycosyltransferase, partial [Nitrospiraceae bacterium]|nr:glycosyltransferase [Nitrospiraceae bacterium]
DLHDVNCGYKAYRTEVVKRIDVYGELHRLIPVLAANLGYRVAEIPVEHHPRLFGRSKYGVERFSKGALDVVSVLFLSRYRFAPGHFFGKVGAGAILAGLVCAAGAMAGLAILDSVPLALAIAAVGAGLIGGGMGVLALGLVAELVLTQHPPGSPSLYVDEDAPGDET